MVYSPIILTFGLVYANIQLQIMEKLPNKKGSEMRLNTVQFSEPIASNLLVHEYGLEAATRLSLNEKFEAVIEKGKDNKLTEADRKTFYSELTSFLESDTNNGRIILYIPFEVLPDLKTDDSSEAVKLADSIKSAWFRLLYESEVRAVYVDGDELEPEVGIPARVRKAAHLSPFLIERGILTEDYLLDIFDLSDEIELDESLLAGFVAAKDLKVVTERFWTEVCIMAKDKNIDIPNNQNVEVPNYFSNPNEVLTNFTQELASINNKYSDESPYVKNMTQKRAKWEKSVKIEELRNETADLLAPFILDRSISLDELGGVGLAMRSLFKAIKLSKSKSLLEENENKIIDKWFHGSTHEKEEIKTGLNHIVRLGVDTTLHKRLSIDILDLSEPMPINMPEFLRADGKILKDIARKIKEDPEISKYIYPSILVFGSRIRGYARIDGDFDMAIFVKPNITWGDRSKIISILSTKMPEIKNIDRVMEYWISEKDGDYSIKVPDSKLPDTVIGPQQIHFIWGGVWLGDSQMTNKLKSDLVKKYTNLERFEEQKETVRTTLLRQIELSVLQYRLMHKGYKKLYPSAKSEKIEALKSIDGNSDFWDKGFRRIATNLFLKSVFLPDLSDIKQ